ncbi:DNA adenine methylase [Sedimentisphaera salicampi]|uniref:Site-specific DNA-methyltransferase (adenine-specific) n=1 Tax=Sedimentisphaera salicampi TaxID=1941349 RepID=A0A1W6LQF3_9BACT|nr:DNA adenine methylase [Sedimentisphaera salicampi]ARN57962.1 Modification methylase DpnIIA [Sedimentisphaera salicampi]
MGHLAVENSNLEIIKKKAKPFLKWAGGKRKLVPEIEARLPSNFNSLNFSKYAEPFLGGGAFFFHLVQEYDFIEKSILVDSNPDLINCFEAIKTDFNKLIEYLESMKNEYLSSDEEGRRHYFLKIRSEYNKAKLNSHSTLTAAQMLFLNRTCFNGLYRLNKKGEFNVPHGKYKSPSIYDKENYMLVSNLLQNAELILGDFQDCISYLDEETLVYLDPPYRPISNTASFTSYSKGSFAEKDQVRLADFCRELDQKGVKFILSNSDPKNEEPNDNFFEKYFDLFKIERVKANRAINCKGSKRGAINELIITNIEE